MARKAIILQKTGKMAERPLILAVETSGRIGSVAIGLAEQMLAQSVFSAPMTHSCEIFPSIIGLLEALGGRPGEIEHVYISVGPGSFTGLRIAVALAKIMHLANSVKLVAVDTMDVIAANVSDYVKKKGAEIARIATILDAKRGQFYVAGYQQPLSSLNDTQDAICNTQYEKFLGDCIMTAAQFLEEFAGQNEPIWLLGEGLLYNKDKFAAENVHLLDQDYWRPQAAKVHLIGWAMAQQGKFADPISLQPNYLLRPGAEEKWQGP
jgi:tRNA threonylcarbamoyladenosine biosynthesis protein TsaB